MDFDEFLEKEFCINAIRELHNTQDCMGISDLELLNEWHSKYRHHFDSKNLHRNKNYTFISKFNNYLNIIRIIKSFIEKDDPAAKLLNIFQDKVFQNEDARFVWLMTCLDYIPDLKLGVYGIIKKNRNSVSFSDLQISIKHLQNYMNLIDVFSIHAWLLPVSVRSSLEWGCLEYLRITPVNGEEEDDTIEDEGFIF